VGVQPTLDKLVHYRERSLSSPSLTTRQQELLRLLQQGLDNQAIAQRLGLSVKTVENHLTRLYRQINVLSRLEAVNYVTSILKSCHRPGRPIGTQPSSRNACPGAGHAAAGG